SIAHDNSPVGNRVRAPATKDAKDQQGKLEPKRPIRKFVTLDIEWIKSLVAQQDAASESASGPRPADPALLVAPIRAAHDQTRGSGLRSGWRLPGVPAPVHPAPRPSRPAPRHSPKRRRSRRQRSTSRPCGPRSLSFAPISARSERLSRAQTRPPTPSQRRLLN